MRVNLRHFLQARSFSEARSVSLSEERPDAYVEWGGPTDFDIDSFADNADNHDGGGEKARQHVNYWQAIGSLATADKFFSHYDTFVQSGSLFIVKDEFYNIHWRKLAFNSSKGRGVVFHLKAGAANKPKIASIGDIATPDEAITEGFFPYDIEDYSDIN